MLQQVWINLLDNAIKFSPADGVITVTISQDALHTRISVSIEGVGIEPSAQAHIFDKFYQADPSHATQETDWVSLLSKKSLICTAEPSR